MKIFNCILLLATLTVSGCVYYSKMAVPASPVDKEKIQIIEHVNKQVGSVRLFMIGGVPSAMDLVHEAITELRGDGIVNLEVTFSEGFLGPITFPKVTIEGDVVRLRAEANQVPEANSAISASLLVKVPQIGGSKSIVAADSVDPEAMRQWKLQVREAYKSSWVSKGFAKYLAKTQQNVEYNEWVETLSERDYKNYQTSSYNVQDWLLVRWKKTGSK